MLSIDKHMHDVPKETHVVPVMTTLPLETRAEVTDGKGYRLLSHPVQRQNRLTARDKNPRRKC